MAVASDASGFGVGMNKSILFMLSMVFLIPAAIALLVWNTYRAQRAAGAERFVADGKLRWGDPPR